MKIRVLTTLFLVFISCKNVTKTDTEQIKTEQIKADVDSTELKIKTTENQNGNKNLNSFLENPIDLQNFKKLKNSNLTTTGVDNGMNYHFHPKFKDSIYYSYNYPTKNFKDARKIDRILVFKYGKGKHKYDDESEILIELRIFNKDSDLGKANLVGLSKTELESKFGVDYLTLDNKMIYSYKDKVLILILDNSKVKSFRYIKLSTEKIDKNLIEHITK